MLPRNFHRGSLVAIASLITLLNSVGVFPDILPDILRYALCLLLFRLERRAQP